MYYKVMYNNRVIDVLDHLIFMKHQSKHNIMVLCSESEAQATLSSDGETIWHVKGWYNIPVDGYETVELIEIDEFEYRQLKMLNGKTPEEIVDEIILFMVNANIL